MSAVNVVRGIEHVGVTVPDIEAATKFFVEAFGAEPMYDMHAASPPASDNGDESRSSDQATLGVRAGVRWLSSRMLHLGEGPQIELFAFHDAERREPATASDLGVQHIALYVDDMEAARSQVIAAGGRALAGPSTLPGPEAGDGNQWLYTLTPWGSIVELICLPSPQAYEQTTNLRRWRPAARIQEEA